MNRATKAKLFALVFAFSILAASAIHAKHAEIEQPPAAQTPQSQPSPQSPSSPATAAQAPQEPKNVQLLKGMTTQQIFQQMQQWAASLGVKCSYCHVRPFEQDTPRKMTARLMLRDYVMGMKHKDGSAVSCKDCHNGQATPLRTRAFETAFTMKQGGRQVLNKDMSRDKVMEVMNAFTKALGVKCDYCHNMAAFDFNQDTPRKQIARFMMTEFSGKLAKADGSSVTCYDCHKGQPRPLADLAPPRPAHAEPAPEKKPGS